MAYAKRYDFRRQLKDMTLEQLISFRDSTNKTAWSWVGINDKEADKNYRYVGYIDKEIKKRNAK